jgi:putative phosphoribosyl transferase
MFKDRKDGGRQLAARLGSLSDQADILVLALPRGGVVTGAEVARNLNAQLDVLIVRKIGHPWQPELAAGAVSETGTVVYNEDVVATEGVTEEYLLGEVARQREEIERRVRIYRGGRMIASMTGRIVILVDDGVATGATMKAAIQTLNKERIKKLVVAVPVAPPGTVMELRRMVSDLVCVSTPLYFASVGSHYDEFTQVSDDEVVQILEEFRPSDA